MIEDSDINHPDNIYVVKKLSKGLTKDMFYLEGYLISVWHFCVGQDCHHPLLVVDRFWWWHRESQSLMFQQVAEKLIFILISHPPAGCHLICV